MCLFIFKITFLLTGTNVPQVWKKITKDKNFAVKCCLNKTVIP